MKKSNILIAINNLSIYASNDLLREYVSNNRANNVGDALELFIRDSFCDSFLENEVSAMKRYSEIFSYLGNSSNPPDIIIHGGDAIEVKKLEGFSAIALNSSYPKQKIHNSPSNKMITDTCRHCEDDTQPWIEKDVIYAIGNVADKKLKCLFFVYGDCYSASEESYTRIADKIKRGIEELSDIELSETNELGKLKRVDPLGITDLRIRGMWHIENPIKVFDYIIKDHYENDKDMNMFLIMRKEKYESFDNDSRKLVEDNKLLNIVDVKIKDPDNPAKLIEAKLIVSYL